MGTFYGIGTLQEPRTCLAHTLLGPRLELWTRMSGGYEVMIAPPGILGKVGSPAAAMKDGRTR